MRTDWRINSSTQGTGTCELRSGLTRSRSSGSYPCAIAAANRTRSRVCGSRLSCFAITVPRIEARVVNELPPAGSIARNIARRTALPRCRPAMQALAFAIMQSIRRAFVGAALFFVVGTGAARAQASPYLPLDDARLPLLEHLIARGDIEDPSPMIRPFRRADALRALAAADSAAESAARGPAAIVHALRATFEELPGEQTWRVAARAGAQAYSHIRRDVLHPLGPDGVRPYADLTGEA